MKKIRRGATTVRVQNEGSVVFLYDEANAEAVRRAVPELLHGFGATAAADPVLGELARDGRLVAYQLAQDDDVALELAVGKPLTEKELGAASWLPVQRAPLHAPSGRLRIETHANLSLSPDRDPDAEPGATVDVEPGDYVLSLHRVDGHACPSWRGPWEVVVLVQEEDAEPVGDPAPMLLLETTPEREEWVGAYQVRGGLFRGLALFADDGDHFELNVDPEAAQTLGLAPGAILQLEVEGAPVLEGVYIGEDLTTARSVLEALERTGRSDLWQVQWIRSDDPAADHLLLLPSAASHGLPADDRGRWIEVAARRSGSVLES